MFFVLQAEVTSFLMFVDLELLDLELPTHSLF